MVSLSVSALVWWNSISSLSRSSHQRHGHVRLQDERRLCLGSHTHNSPVPLSWPRLARSTPATPPSQTTEPCRVAGPNNRSGPHLAICQVSGTCWRSRRGTPWRDRALPWQKKSLQNPPCTAASRLASSAGWMWQNRSPSLLWRLLFEPFFGVGGHHILAGSPSLHKASSGIPSPVAKTSLECTGYVICVPTAVAGDNGDPSAAH